MGEIQSPVLKEEEKLQRRLLEATDGIIDDDLRSRLVNATNEQLAIVRKKRYEFANFTHEDLMVGKEGTLVYSVVDGERAAGELDSAIEVVETVPKKVWKIVPDARPEVLDLKARLARATSVADIHQVEVLPEYQGKGVASALLDVANWDIDQAGGIEFSIARVMNDNPDRDKMLEAFGKAGFKKFFITAGWDGRISDHTDFKYYLVVRENPKFQKDTQGRDP